MGVRERAMPREAISGRRVWSGAMMESHWSRVTEVRSRSPVRKRSQAVEGSPTTEATMRGTRGSGRPASGVGASAGTVSVRHRADGDLGAMALDEFQKKIEAERRVELSRQDG